MSNELNKWDVEDPDGFTEWEQEQIDKACSAPVPFASTVMFLGLLCTLLLLGFLF